MHTSRNSIISRLRGANIKPLDHESLRYQPWESDDSELLKQRFTDHLTASHAQVIASDMSGLSEVLIGVIANKQLKRVAVGTAGTFYDDIKKATQEVERVTFDCDFAEIKSELFTNVEAGITHCRAGIADTGALVLWPDTAEPRTLSLVPPCHIALIQRSTIASNFSTLMVAQEWASGMPTNVVLISGPSKTADIQQTLAYGAHGPSELVVIIIEDM